MQSQCARHTSRTRARRQFAAESTRLESDCGHLGRPYHALKRLSMQCFSLRTRHNSTRLAGERTHGPDRPVTGSALCSVTRARRHSIEGIASQVLKAVRTKRVVPIR